MTKVEPALTPAEWRSRHTQGRNRFEAWISYDGREVVLHQGHPGAQTPADRHALAALCLHGQDFGFTWEDVDRVRDVARIMDTPEMIDWAHSVADRIAALLPPREEPGK